LHAHHLFAAEPGAHRKVIGADRREDLTAAPGDPAARQDVIELQQRAVGRVGAPAHRWGIPGCQPGDGQGHVEVPGDHGRNVVDGQPPDEAEQLYRAEQPVGQVGVDDPALDPKLRCTGR
jgi:hypothetical protein